MNTTQEIPAWIGEPDEKSPARDWIAFPKGLLNIITGEFRPSTRRFFTLNALPFDYDPLASEPAGLLAFLRDLWGDDAESIGALQEVMGYCLSQDTRQQKAFLLVGPPRAGKGTIARVIQAMVGRHNYASPTLANMGQSFGLESLIGKQLAVISDARLGARVDQSQVAENLLRITGEDSISVPRKFRVDWTGKLNTRFLLLANELPVLTDSSGALASRFIILTLTRSFLGAEDQGLTDRLLGELPRVFRWALQGLHRLTRRGRFVQPRSALDAVRQLDVLGSPIRAFVADRCQVGAGRTVEVGELYREWASWCQEQGRHPGTSAILGRNLHAAVPGLAVRQRRKDGAVRRVYEGIGIGGELGTVTR